MAAAQFVEVPGYAALLLRRRYSDLALPGALIDRSREWWLGTRARWNHTEHRWTFPSGASIQFGYLEHENDRYRYQSSEFQFIGFDELTQFTEGQYRYLFSRLRRLRGSCIPLRMRAASNPGGIGHEWVKSRFLRRAEADRLFIPARLEDNPYLDREAYLNSLAELDPITRQQLLAGDWDACQGGRLRREWLRYYQRRGNVCQLAGRAVLVDQIQTRFLTVDTAASVRETARDDPDYTVISAWGLAPPGDLLWLGCLRLRVEVPDIPSRIWEQYQRHQARKVYIEGGGTQKGVVQLVRRFPQAMNVIEITPGGADKLVRATDALNMAEAGRLWLPTGDQSFPLEDVEAEILRFTGDPRRDAHDDIVDTLSMAATVVERHLRQHQQGFAPYVVGGAR